MKRFFLTALAMLLMAGHVSGHRHAVASLDVGEAETGYVPKTDVSQYADVGRLCLSNRWIRSVAADYDNIVFDNGGLMNRGFTVKDGKVLVIGRSADASDADVYILHYSAQNGELLKKVPLDAGVQCSDCPANDIFQDASGHVLISNLVLNIATTPIRIHHVDPDTGAAQLVASLTADGTNTSRVDHCTVSGDIMARSFHVYAAMSSGTEVVKWQVAGAGSAYALSTTVIRAAAFSPATARHFGLAPRAYPGPEESFFVTGSTTHLTRYSLVDGAMIDSFDAYPKLRPEGTEANGAAFFTLGGMHFMLYPYSDFSSPTGFRFMLAQSSESAKYAELSAAWIFPERGMGNVSSATCDALCCVSPGAQPNQMDLFLYVPGNGLAAYTLTAGVLGDVNGDRAVDIVDVNAVINAMLGRPGADVPDGHYDVTGDGLLDVSDVNLIISIMLGG